MNKADINILADQITASVLASLHVSRWLTVHEACDYAKIKRDTLMRWLDEGYIYGSKRSGKWIVDRASIDSFYNQDRLQIL